jgi:hypothetical protein
MDGGLLEKVLDLFEQCQSRGKSLEINIDRDLVPIVPLPRILILDLLSDQSITIISYLSDDKNTLYFQKNVKKKGIFYSKKK